MDTRWENRLHCTAKNPIPIPISYVWPKHILSATSAQIFKFLWFIPSQGVSSPWQYPFCSHSAQLSNSVIHSLQKPVNSQSGHLIPLALTKIHSAQFPNSVTAPCKSLLFHIGPLIHYTFRRACGKQNLVWTSLSEPNPITTSHYIL